MEIDEFLDKELGKMGKGPKFEGAPQKAEEIIKAPEPAPETAEKKEAVTRPKEALKEDIDILIEKANGLISKGDFEGAREIYLKIKNMKRDLPKKFIEKEEKIETNLTDINEKLVHKMDKALNTEFNEKFTKIKRFLDEAHIHIKDNKISSKEELKRIEDIYKKIKDIYITLPEGFMEKKVMVQDQMLKLYRIIITNKKDILSHDFTAKSLEIIKTMNEVAKEITANNFDEASKLFSRTTKLYKELPQGFLKEKTGLQSKILSIYQKLVLGRENNVHGEFDRSYSEIKSMFREAYALMKKDRINEAFKAYGRIAERYSKLPKGYYGKKADIEIEMMELHHLISLKKDKELLKESKSKINEIELLLESARNYIISGEYDLAREAYYEVNDLYNSLPEGFFEENVKVQNKIIALYKDILHHAHKPLITKITEGEKSKYDELLKLMVEIHRHIKKKEFGEIKNKYLFAYKLYHELPLGLIEEKKDLYKEIYKVYEELKLYTSLGKLAEYAEKEDFESMRNVLDDTAQQYSILSKKYPEDMALFSHIQSKCLVYLEMLKTRLKGKPETASQVKKRIETFAKTKKDMGGELPAGKFLPGKDKSEPKVKDYLKKKYSIKG